MSAHPIPPDGDELVDYVFGLTSPRRSAEIDVLRSQDEELDAKINVCRAIFGSEPSPPARPRGRFWTMTIAIVAVALLCGFTTYKVLFAPLLHDDFADGWFDSKLWENPPEIKGAGIREEKGFIRLVNRGRLVTRREHPTPVEVTVRWKWINLGLNPNYADHLTIVTRTSGRTSQERPYEAVDGARVSFFANGGGVVIQKVDPVVAPGQFPPGHYLAIPMPADEWITVRVADDGRRIRVYMAGPGIDPKFEREPVYERDVDGNAGGRIAIYNREFVGFPHESHLDYVRIDRFRGE